MRICFINPPSGLARDFYEIPLNIAYLVACVRSRPIAVDFDVVDMELAVDKDPWAVLERRGLGPAPDVIAAPLYTYSLGACLTAIERLRHYFPEALTIVGGPHATLADTEMISREFIDVLIVGEGDDSFPEVIEALEKHGRRGLWSAIRNLGGVVFKDHISQGPAKKSCATNDTVLPASQLVRNARRPLIRNLDRVPLATDGYDLFDLDEVHRLPGFVPVMSSRGCPYSCIFCSSADLWQHRINFRTTENIRTELEAIKSYGFNAVNFRDDLFTIRRKRTIELSLVLGELGMVWGCETRADAVDEELLRIMVDNGLCTIRFGIESFHQKTLDLLKKEESVEDYYRALEACARVGVPEVRNSFMIGLPGETEADIRETIRIARSFDFTTNRFWAFTPVLGTEAHSRMDSYGVQWNQTSGQVRATASTIKTSLLSNETINQLVEEAHKEFGHPLSKKHRDLQRTCAARQPTQNSSSTPLSASTMR